MHRCVFLVQLELCQGKHLNRAIEEMRTASSEKQREISQQVWKSSLQGQLRASFSHLKQYILRLFIWGGGNTSSGTEYSCVQLLCSERNLKD